MSSAEIVAMPGGDSEGFAALCIGPIYLDVNCVRFPCENGLPAEEEIVGREYEIAPGGSAVNFARFGRSLGLHTILAGKVGCDAFGQATTQMLRDSGVVLAVRVDDLADTALGINFVAPSGVTAMASVGSASELLRESDVSAAVDKYADSIAYIYLGGCFKVPHLVAYFEELAEFAHKQKIQVVLDHGRIPRGTPSRIIASMRSLASTVDLYFPSRTEFLALWDGGTLDASARQALQAGVRDDRVIAVKDGALGAVAFTQNARVQVRANEVEPWNTVGAGDSFNAGFVTARSLNLDLKESLDFACAAAAIKISSLDLPTRAGIERLLVAG